MNKNFILKLMHNLFLLVGVFTTLYGLVVFSIDMSIEFPLQLLSLFALSGIFFCFAYLTKAKSTSDVAEVSEKESRETRVKTFLRMTFYVLVFVLLSLLFFL